jgi:hypothetical protein
MMVARSATSASDTRFIPGDIAMSRSSTETMPRFRSTQASGRKAISTM